MKIPFISFESQLKENKTQLINNIERVLDSQWYVLGESVKEFENKYKKLSRVKYVSGVGSGLDALIISLKALNISKGDEVIVASNAYIASWLSITNVGATIVPVEPNEKTFNIDVDKIEDKITANTKVIMPVHLYGQPCEMDKIIQIAKKYKLFVIEDNAQAHLAKFMGKITGSFGDINATSFYPTKNIGAIGEAGCITTDNIKHAKFSNKFRNYGSSEKYICELIGTNSRLDELQASILNVKLDYIEHWTRQRIEIAKLYTQRLINLVETPFVNSNCTHVYHLYVIKTDKRDELKEFLLQKGIGTAVHYPIPPHLQKAYSHLNFKKGDFPIAEKLANQSLSLPIYPGLNNDQVNYICDSIKEFFKS
jgi:dTDP-4-amino-4,6-dideoxygalactose transaminase